MSGNAQALLRVGRNVADIDRACGFYCEALGFVVVARNASPAWPRLPGMDIEAPPSVRLRLGDQEIELTAFAGSTPYPPASCSNDMWFQHCAIVVADMDAAYAKLQRYAGAAPITRGGPQTLPASSGGVVAYKFRDPDGHPLELIMFPPGSGDPQWQHKRNNGAALGLDHSAISVADVDRSSAFYQGLGLSQASRQTNHGAEQQRLDDLPGVIVDVVALKPALAVTPHIELLGYQVPRGRALSNPDVRDIAADRLVLQIADLDALLENLARANADVVAAGTIENADGVRAALLRDPDGHLLVLVD